ncbi:MAG: transporter substrate-binding domain-containing protein [Alphaproteobacteria bacterium]
MKHILTILAAVVLSLGVVHLWGPAGGQNAPHKETAYERVMRTGVLRCGYAPWPPYYDYNPNTKELTGIAKDFSDKIFQLLALKVEYIQLNVATAVQDMKMGRVDAMCFDGPWVIPAAKIVDYTRPWLYAPVYVYGKNLTVADLNKETTRFIGLDGDLSVDAVPHIFPKAQAKAFPGGGDYAMLFVEIDAGRADATIIDAPSYQKYIANNETLIELITKKPVAVYPAGMSVAKGEVELLSVLDSGIHMAIAMGLAEQFAQKLDPTGVSIIPVTLPLKGVQ